MLFKIFYIIWLVKALSKEREGKSAIITKTKASTASVDVDATG